MAVTDEYLREYVVKGDAGSRLMAHICSPTLKNSEYVDVINEGMNGIATLRLPADYLAVVHSLGGDPTQSDLSRYSASLVERLVDSSKIIGAKPIAFANIIDASTIDLTNIEIIGNSLARRANNYGLAIVNGELAGLGDRVTVPANISGTMLSIIPKTADLRFISQRGRFSFDGVNYAFFDHEGMPVYLNSDGVGTKSEFAERSQVLDPILTDSFVMKADDAGKLGARIMVVSDVVETNGFDPMSELSVVALRLGEKYRFEYILQHENVGGRIRGYGNHAINVSGSAVSVIDEALLKNLPKPRAGEYLIAIRGRPNPRSNGITDKRKIMVEMLGQDWHKTEEGKKFMEFLGEPSTIFYGLFSGLRERGIATSFYHMSGGAYDGKLARPLAKHGLFAQIKGLYPVDWREEIIVRKKFTQPEIAFAKWPMGNEGFVTTSNPAESLEFIRAQNLECKVVSRLEIANNGRTGVELAEITASDGKPVYYSGKN
jgi:phosphoribosylaminoimidazole (AIR) synthetase